MLEENSRYSIGVALKTMDSEHWQGIRSGMEQAAKEQNITLTLLSPKDEWAEDEQKVMIQDLLESDIDALIVAPCNSTSTGWFVDRAKEKGITLLTVDTRSLDRDIPYVGIDNEEAGRMAATYLMDNLLQDEKLAVIGGAKKQAQTIDRVGSFEKAITWRSPDTPVTVKKEITGFSDSLHVTKTLIAQEIKGLYCASAVMGLGAAAAEAETGTDICIVTIDSQVDAIKAVQKGTVDALITQSGYDIGQTAIDTAVQYLEGAPQDNVYLPCELLTQENVDEYLKREEP
jgi:ribose transport system substrate-binding protein